MGTPFAPIPGLGPRNPSWGLVLRKRSAVLFTPVRSRGQRGSQHFRFGKRALVYWKDGARTRAEAGRKAFKLQEGLPFLVEYAGARGPHLPLLGLERPLVV